MGRQLLASFLCLVLTLPFSGKLYVALDFVIHQDVIAATQCENRDKPELECNGKCVLMQKLQLKTPDDKPTQNLPEILRMEVSQFTCDEHDFPDFKLLDSLRESPFPILNEAPVRRFASSVFHPPRYVV